LIDPVAQESPFMPSRARFAARCGLAFLVCAIAQFAAVQAADNPVVGAIAIDSYADVKKQVAWVGEQVGFPQLSAMMETGIMTLTQFKGLAGLDPARPIGVVVTASGETPVVHGYIPVKNLDQLLEVFQGVVGPAQKDGDKRILMPPGAPPIEIVEKDGWAVVAMQGSAAGTANPEAILTKLTGELSIGAQLFPAAMPEAMREQVKAMIEQGADAAAAQGQPVDAAVLGAAFESLAETESLTFGVAIEPAKERLFFENRTVMVAGSDAAAVWATAGKVDRVIGLPVGADGKAAAVLAYHAQAVPEATRAAVEATLAQSLPAGTGDPVNDTVFGLLQDIVGAMLDAGSVNIGLALDTSGAKADALLPAVTISAMIKDGPVLEAQIKKRLGVEGSLPPAATVKFDTGKQAGANLHEITLDLAGVPGAEKIGEKLVITLAVGADRACILLGGDVAKRLDSALESAAKGDAGKKPLTGVDLSVAGLMAYSAATMTATGNEDAAAVLVEVAKDAAAKPSAQVQVMVRPIQQGVAMRLTIDAGALQAIAAAVTAQMSLKGAPGPGADFDGF
jgi:hypothetical protein